MLSYDDLPRRLNLASWFLDRNLEEGRGDDVALIVGDDEAWTYARLAALTNRIGNVLRDAGVRPEERVLIALSDGAGFVASWYAVLKLGAVVAEVYTFLAPKDYAYVLDYTRARVVLVDATTEGPMREAARAARHLEHVLVVDSEDFDARVAQASDELDPAPTTRDDLAIWKFTTGSTGLPKAAVHLVHDPIVSFECYGKGVLGMHAGDRVLPVPKLFFGYGRDVTTLFTFGVGATGIVFPERATPERLFALIERHRPTILVQVPAMMRAMLGHAGAEARDLSSLRFCISSGEALPAELHEQWNAAFGVEVLDGVGSSEAYHIYVSNQPGRVRAGSVGQVVPGYEATLVDAAGEPVPDGETGELWVSGESTALLYWDDHAKSKQTFAGDLVRTGDLFARDADGFFWYRGRADDLIKVRGIWVAPAEIEASLLEHPGVRECAVVGIQDETGLAVPCAFVVAAEGAAPAERELQDHVRSHLSPHKYPREVRFVGDLPRTGSGKVDRRALRTIETAKESV